ncbi:uncharacterized protein LOC142983635 [Anticarsia gemmatalis]|uniref:uncharacterized protein LOC142983635 n=1 Tax=Anticarsia gemmatalis TaxID=129554 RepID=UPI003F768880
MFSLSRDLTMRDSLFIVVFCVWIVHASSVVHNEVKDIIDIRETEESSGKEYATFSDGPLPDFLPVEEVLCHKNHRKCLMKIKGGNVTTVCAYHKTHGLVKFMSICDISIENCLVKAFEDENGKPAKKETYFYNNQGKSCKYYVDQANSMEDAIKLYHMHAFKHIKKFREPL